MRDDPKPTDPNTIATTISSTSFLIPAPSIETFVRLPDDNPIYSLVGQVASDWAFIEHILDLIIWELAGINHAKGACLTAQITGHHNKCDSIIALETYLGFSASTIKRVEDLKGSLYNVSNPRNRIVHDPWILIRTVNTQGLFTEPGQYKSMARRELKFGASKADIDWIQETISKIQSKTRECSELRTAIISELATLPKK